MMAAKHLHRIAFNRSSCVRGALGFSARKLIYFVLLQLVLSSFVLITADTSNGSQRSDNEAALAQPSSFEPPELTPQPYLASRFGCLANTITDGITWNGTKLKCTGDDSGDGVLTSDLAFNEIQRKTTKENLILWHNASSIDDVDGGNSGTHTNAARRPDDDNNLSLTGNASTRNQSQQAIANITGDSIRQQQQHHRRRRHQPADGTFNKDGERVLSRKRRYLIFPPGSSIQIGKLYLHFYFSFPFKC